MNTIKSKNISFLIVLISVLLVAFHSCKNNRPSKENTVLQQDIESSEEKYASANIVSSKIDSAYIRLELGEPFMDSDFETLKMSVVNNSEYTLSTGNAFTLRYLDFGFWSVVPAVENAIWTDEEIPVHPQSSREYEFFYGFYDFDFVSGKYRIEKNVRIVNPDYEDGDNKNLRYMGERTLVVEFEIK